MSMRKKRPKPVKPEKMGMDAILKHKVPKGGDWYMTHSHATQAALIQYEKDKFHLAPWKSPEDKMFVFGMYAHADDFCKILMTMIVEERTGYTWLIQAEKCAKVYFVVKWNGKHDIHHERVQRSETLIKEQLRDLMNKKRFAQVVDGQLTGIIQEQEFEIEQIFTRGVKDNVWINHYVLFVNDSFMNNNHNGTMHKLCDNVKARLSKSDRHTIDSMVYNRDQLIHFGN